ncbi:hypothetical protein BCR43DRAFT_518889 [Syncephalastrum racemosum]|uniref:Uncharacterized protein n=1 Tax=Syncephalastrum racemosum TaxID=13706 RepID=A0A1X2H0B1_SYNRA|nr:hypothetical protein BCR43DRAFT_518889 [Syncephalastrum racemosum]
MFKSQRFHQSSGKDKTIYHYTKGGEIRDSRDLTTATVKMKSNFKRTNFVVQGIPSHSASTAFDSDSQAILHHSMHVKVEPTLGTEVFWIGEGDFRDRTELSSRRTVLVPVASSESIAVEETVSDGDIINSSNETSGHDCGNKATYKFGYSTNEDMYKVLPAVRLMRAATEARLPLRDSRAAIRVERRYNLKSATSAQSGHSAFG